MLQQVAELELSEDLRVKQVITKFLGLGWVITLNDLAAALSTPGYAEDEQFSKTVCEICCEVVRVPVEGIHLGKLSQFCEHPPASVCNFFFEKGLALHDS